MLFLVCQACQNWREERDGKDSVWSLFQRRSYYSIFVSWKGCDLALAARHPTGDGVGCVSEKEGAGWPEVKERISALRVSEFQDTQSPFYTCDRKIYFTVASLQRLL